MRRSNFASRAPPTLLAEVRKAAKSEGVALNQLITLALAEKLSAMGTEEYFEERARRADPARINRILAHVGNGRRPYSSGRASHVSRGFLMGATLGAAKERKMAPNSL